jgi:membrane-associated phospholipid phosphatase
MGLKSGTKRLLGWFREILEGRVAESERLAIAGVHTTLIAVFVACLSAYMVFAYNTVQQAELKAIDEAERINSFIFLIHQCPYGGPFEGAKQIDIFDRDKLRDIITAIGGGHETSSLPRSINGRAHAALLAMRGLVSQYPFPIKFFKPKQGAFGSRGDPEPISFANLNEVRTWVDAMDVTTGAFLYAMEFLGGRILALLKEFGKSAEVSEERNTIMKSAVLGPMTLKKVERGFGTYITLDGLDIDLVYSDFLDRIKEARRIMISTQNYVRRADALRAGYPSKHRMYLVFFLAAMAFAFGVIYPLAEAKVRRVLALWLPFLIYALIVSLSVGVVL